MSMIAQQKYCMRCKKMWSYNPDLGHRSCPYCMERTIEKLQSVQKILKSCNNGHPGYKDI